MEVDHRAGLEVRDHVVDPVRLRARVLEDGLDDTPDAPVEVVAVVGKDSTLRCVPLELEHVRLETLEAIVELVAVQDTPRVSRTESSLRLIRSDRSTQMSYQPTPSGAKNVSLVNSNSLSILG